MIDLITATERIAFVMKDDVVVRAIKLAGRDMLIGPTNSSTKRAFAPWR